MEEYSGIGLFEPGSVIEREVDWNLLFHVLILTGVAFGITIGLTILLMVPLIGAGLIQVNLATGNIWLDPIAIIVITLAEVGFVLPPIWYVRKNGYTLASLGLKRMKSLKEVAMGLGIGIAMLMANLIVTLIIGFLYDAPVEGEGFFLVTSALEALVWIVLMFLVVGFSEELLFRGFLQRRMEMYFTNRKSSPGLYALIITSFIFAAIHLDLIGLPTRFILGLFLGYLAQKRNYSIMAPTVAHGFNNAAVVVLAFLGF